MNEDDTFKALKKPTLEQLHILTEEALDKVREQRSGCTLEEYYSKLDLAFTMTVMKHGWTLDEYANTIYERNEAARNADRR